MKKKNFPPSRGEEEFFLTEDGGQVVLTSSGVEARGIGPGDCFLNSRPFSLEEEDVFKDLLSPQGEEEELKF